MSTLFPSIDTKLKMEDNEPEMNNEDEHEYDDDKHDDDNNHYF